MMDKANLKLKPYNTDDAYLHLKRWASDPYYRNIWRGLSPFISENDIINFPSFSGNMTMFITDLDDVVVGLAVAYHFNFRNQTIHLGTLIDKQYRGWNYGRNSQALWSQYLIEHFGIRKMNVEILEEFMIPYFEEVGYRMVGVRKEQYLFDGLRHDEYILECFVDDYKVVYKEIPEGKKAINGVAK